MSTAKNRRKKWFFALAVGALVLSLGYVALQIFADRLNESLISEKEYHETTATVTRKEVVKFDQQNHSYINDFGDRIEVRPGDVQYRVYFEFNEFNGYDEPFRSQLLRAEKKRLSDGRPRYTWDNFNDRSLYDSVKVGDKLIVSYKAFSDTKIDVRHAERLER